MIRRPASLLFVLGVLAGCMIGTPTLPPVPEPMPAGPPPPNGSIWRSELAANYPFIDVRAHFPGDLVTVIVSEQSKGKKDATTEVNHDSSIMAKVEDFFGIPESDASFLPDGFNNEAIVDAQSTRKSKGEGTTTREGNLTAAITVTVMAIEPSGTLRVQGEKIVTVNQEEQHIVLAGRVRPEDIASDNSVLSSRIADARIVYTGIGVVADKQGVPLVHRLFDWVWPF